MSQLKRPSRINHWILSDKCLCGHHHTDHPRAGCAKCDDCRNFMPDSMRWAGPNPEEAK